MKQPDKTKEMASVEIIIGQILRIGVIVSAAVIIIGLGLFLITRTSGYPTGVYPYAPSVVLKGAIALKPYAIIMLGIFCLILTPVLRVVVSIYAFAKEGDYLYVWITSIVLVILIIAMVIGYFGK